MIEQESRPVVRRPLRAAGRRVSEATLPSSLPLLAASADGATYGLRIKTII
jgi:hypothetical protein